MDREKGLGSKDRKVIGPFKNAADGRVLHEDGDSRHRKVGRVTNMGEARRISRTAAVD